MQKKEREELRALLVAQDERLKALESKVQNPSELRQAQVQQMAEQVTEKARQELERQFDQKDTQARAASSAVMCTLGGVGWDLSDEEAETAAKRVFEEAEIKEGATEWYVSLAAPREAKNSIVHVSFNSSTIALAAMQRVRRLKKKLPSARGWVWLDWMKTENQREPAKWVRRAEWWCRRVLGEDVVIETNMRQKEISVNNVPIGAVGKDTWLWYPQALTTNGGPLTPEIADLGRDYIPVGTT